MDYDPSSVVSCRVMLRPPDYGNNLLKHVEVNLELTDPAISSTHLLAILQ
jgi:hypothetical protein